MMQQVTETPFESFESADEQMVLDEIKGRAIDTLVYEVRGVTGLSLAGVRETARMMNTKNLARIKISDHEPVVIETDDYFEVRVYACDEMNGGGNWGIKRQDKRYDNATKNQFAYEQALAKAQRNALRGLIPEWFVKEMISQWRDQKRGSKTVPETVRRVDTTTGEIKSPAPAPLDAATAAAVKDMTSSKVHVPSHENGGAHKPPFILVGGVFGLWQDLKDYAKAHGYAVDKDGNVTDWHLAEGIRRGGFDPADNKLRMADRDEVVTALRKRIAEKQSVPLDELPDLGEVVETAAAS